MKDKKSLPVRFHVRYVKQDPVSVLARMLSNRWFKTHTGNNLNPAVAVKQIRFGLWLKQFNFIRRSKSDQRRKNGDKVPGFGRLPNRLRTCPPPGVDVIVRHRSTAPADRVYYCNVPACVFCWSRRVAARLPLLRYAADNQLSADGVKLPVAFYYCSVRVGTETARGVSLPALLRNLTKHGAYGGVIVHVPGISSGPRKRVVFLAPPGFAYAGRKVKVFPVPPTDSFPDPAARALYLAGIPPKDLADSRGFRRFVAYLETLKPEEAVAASAEAEPTSVTRRTRRKCVVCNSFGACMPGNIPGGVPDRYNTAPAYLPAGGKGGAV